MAATKLQQVAREFALHNYKDSANREQDMLEEIVMLLEVLEVKDALIDRLLDRVFDLSDTLDNQ